MPATVAGIHGYGDHASRPAANAAGLPVGALYYCTDHDLVYITDGSTWTTWLDNTSAAVADIVDLPTAETDDTLVLAPDGAGGVEFRAESGGSLTSAAAALSGDVTLTNSGTWYDGPSVALTAGTWLIGGHANFQNGTGNLTEYQARLYDGTTVHDHATGTQTGNGYRVTVGLSAVVTLGGSVTMKLQGARDAGGTATLKRDPAGNGWNLATRIWAVKIA